MYNAQVSSVTGYHRRREKITEIQELKSLTIDMPKSKSLITCKFPIIMGKVNEDLGLLALTTTYHEILIINVNTSEKLEILQDAIDRANVPNERDPFLYPVIEWHQELLYIVDDVSEILSSRQWSRFSTVRARERALDCSKGSYRTLWAAE